MKPKVKYWVDLSDYDLETANAMLESDRLLYVGFMCHQSIEKILKALYCSRFNDTPPFSHNLSYLAEKAEIIELFPEELKDFIDILEPLNIEARYPTHKEQLLKSLTKSKCNEIISKTLILQTWIREKL